MASLPPMPYIIPLILGMTFDARNSRPGVCIYDDEYVNNATIVPFNRVETKYSVVTEMADLLKTLDISGDLSLKIKSGMVDVKGAGSFLRNEKDIQNSVIILTTFKYTAMTKVFGSKAKPIDGWATKFSPAVLGTHYVSEVTYGIEMIASAKFVARNHSDVKNIKADVEAIIKPKGDAVDLTAKGKLEMIEKQVGEKAKLEISYYGTLPLKNIPNSIDGLRELIKTFHQQVKDAGLEDGIPRTVKLSSLVDLADPADKEKFRFIKNEALMKELQDFEKQFLELNSARAKLVNWVKFMPFDLSTEDKDLIGELMEKISSVSDAFYKTLWKMDLTKGSDQLQEAFDAYGVATTLKYNLKVKRLTDKIDAKVDKDAYAVSDTYTHWGNSTCSGGKSIKLYDGYTVSSIDDKNGGARQYACVPLQVDSKYDISPKDDRQSTFVGVSYADLDRNGYPFKGNFATKIKGKGVPCAKCYSPDAASITMFAADDTCPSTWELKYRGYLMSSKLREGHTTEYVCVDELPTKPLDVTSKSDSKNVLTLTTVHGEGALPDSYTEGKLLKCVVCAMRSQNYL